MTYPPRFKPKTLTQCLVSDALNRQSFRTMQEQRALFFNLLAILIALIITFSIFIHITQ